MYFRIKSRESTSPCSEVCSMPERDVPLVGSGALPSLTNNSLVPCNRFPMMCCAIFASFSVSGSSVNNQMMSNRETKGGARLICAVNGTSETGSKRPFLGFAAASTAQRVRRLALIPAFDIEIVCCSIASCILERSPSFILSNSSIAASPRSARTNAPASKVQRPSAAAS